MADWVDSLSDAEVSALYKYKQGGVDSLSDDEVKLMYPHKDKLQATPEAPKHDFLDKAIGAGQAAASLATSGVAMPAGFIAAGLQKLNDPSNVDFEKQTAANMNALTYEPSRELGVEYSEKLGKVFNDVGIPALAHIGGTHLPGVGDISLQAKSKFGKTTALPKGSEIPKGAPD